MKKAKVKKARSSIENLEERSARQFWKNGWWLLIEHVDNGFVLTASSEFGDDGEHVPFFRTVIERSEEIYDGDKQTAELASRLLWEVKEQFGLDSGKHAKFRVKVSVEEQSKEDE